MENDKKKMSRNGLFALAVLFFVLAIALLFRWLWPQPADSEIVDASLPTGQPSSISVGQTRSVSSTSHHPAQDATPQLPSAEKPQISDPTVDYGWNDYSFKYLSAPVLELINEFREEYARDEISRVVKTALAKNSRGTDVREFIISAPSRETIAKMEKLKERCLGLSKTASESGNIRKVFHSLSDFGDKPYKILQINYVYYHEPKRWGAIARSFNVTVPTENVDSTGSGINFSGTDPTTIERSEPGLKRYDHFINLHFSNDTAMFPIPIQKSTVRPGVNKLEG
jgi:hypothetical protein